MLGDRCLFTFYTLTPLHAGAGEAAEAIDLPVQREKHTEYPVVYSSSIKGSLRYYFQITSSQRGYVDEIFGKEGDEAGSGKVVFTDAKILLFPVRSSEGVFKWVTCPFVIERLKRDLMFIGISINIKVSIDNFKGIALKEYKNVVVLEDYPIRVSKCPNASPEVFKIFKALTSNHFEESEFSDRLIIVSDDVFKTLVTNATQIIARNVLEDGTKKSKNLWYEEVVPSDALFYTVMKSTFPGNEEVIKNLITGLSETILQIGGNETIGYGFVKMSENLIEKLTGGK